MRVVNNDNSFKTWAVGPSSSALLTSGKKSSGSSSAAVELSVRSSSNFSSVGVGSLNDDIAGLGQADRVASAIVSNSSSAIAAAGQVSVSGS